MSLNKQILAFSYNGLVQRNKLKEWTTDMYINMDSFRALCWMKKYKTKRVHDYVIPFTWISVNPEVIYGVKIKNGYLWGGGIY